METKSSVTDTVENDDSSSETESDGSSGSDGSSSDDAALASVNEVINIEFEARTPEEPDAASIQRMLGQIFPQASIDLQGLTKIILSQNYVGAVVIQPIDDGPGTTEEPEESEEDIFGITTLINITARRDQKPIEDIMRYLKSCYESRQQSIENDLRFSSFFNWKCGDVGWLINERFINLPSQIAPRLFESLENDLAEAVRKKMQYKLDKYLLIAKAHVTKGGSIQNPVFVNDEEELFYQNIANIKSCSALLNLYSRGTLLVHEHEALASFSFMPLKQQDAPTATAEWKGKKDKELNPLRIVMLLDPNIVKKQISSFAKLFEGV